MTQNNKGREFKGIRAIEIFEFENAKSELLRKNGKNCCDHWEKMKKIFQTNNIYQLGEFIYKSDWCY